MPNLGSNETERIPKAGDRFTLNDLDMIFDAVKVRQEKFPDEPTAISMTIVFLNIGDRFSEVSCIDEAHQWKGLKKDISSNNPNNIPTCPGGHVLVQGKGLQLGWIEGE